MAVVGVPIVEGNNDTIIANNIAEVLREKLREKTLLLGEAKEHLSNALQQNDNLEAALIKTNNFVTKQSNIIKTLLKSIEVKNELQKQKDLYYQKKVQRSFSF